MPISMTRAEYQAKYGTPPDVSGPIKMTRAEYESKYGNTSPSYLSGKSDFASRFADTATEVGAGALKGAGSTIFGAGQLAQKIASPIESGINKLTGYTPPTSRFGPENVLSKTPESLKPKGLAQQIGYGGEKAAEFFVPGGAEKAAVGKIDEAVDTAKFAARFGPKAGKALSSILKIAGSALTTGASTAGVSALQTGGDTGTVKSSGAIGAAGGALGKAFEIFGPSIAKSLTKGNFKLTPAQELKVGKKADDAASFISKNGLIGSPSSQYEKLSTLSSNFEDAVKSSLSKSKDTLAVPVETLNAELDKIPGQFVDQPAIYKSVKADVQEAKDVLNETKDYHGVSFESLLSGKRSYGKAAFGKATAQVKGTIVNSEGAYAIEQAYENVLENAMNNTETKVSIPENLKKYFGGKTEVTMPELNKQYSQVINARKFANAAQFKGDTGLVGRLFGLWAGKTAGYAATGGLGGEIIGGTLGEVASTHVPTMARTAAAQATRFGKAAVPSAKLFLGANSTNP